jgi:hypothetical protein
MQPESTVGNRRTATAVLVTACTALGLALQASSGNYKQKQNTPDLASFRLSMDNLNKAAQATKVLEKLSETDPSLKGVGQFDKQKGLQSIAGAVSRIDDHPRARTAVADTGLSSRDYVLTMYCLEQSAEALFLKSDAGEKPGEKHCSRGTSQENVRFVKKHLKEINQLFSDKP